METDFDFNFINTIKPIGETSRGFGLHPILLKDEKTGEIKEFDFGGFVPFTYQATIMNNIEERGFIKRGFIILPRRAGKTILMIIYLIKKAIEKAKTTDLPLIKYGMVYPDLISGKEVAWDELVMKSEELPKFHKNTQQGFVEFSIWNEKKRKDVRCRIQLVGLQNMDKRRGRGFDGIVIDERGFIPEGFQKVINPMVTDKVRQPTFLINVGTPKEETTFWDNYDTIRARELEGNRDYFTFTSNYEILKHINKETFEDVTAELSQEEIDIEYGCKRGVSTGAKYYTHEIQKALKEERAKQEAIPVNEKQLKVLVCDVGATQKDLFAIWVVQKNMQTGRFQMIGYEEIASADENKVFQFTQDKGIPVGQIILPWDGGNGVRSWQQVLSEKFPNAEVKVLPRGKKADRITRSRTFFSLCEFDLAKTIKGWNCLKNFSKKWDKVSRIYLINPRHDKNSHGADAFGYLSDAYHANYLNFYSNDDMVESGNTDSADSFEPVEDYFKGA